MKKLFFAALFATTFLFAGTAFVSATDVKQGTLYVTAVGGEGTSVYAVPSGTIDCGAYCSHSYDYGTLVTLYPVSTKDSVFSNWEGCPKAVGETCIITISKSEEYVRVIFNNSPQVTLSIDSSGVSGSLGWNAIYVTRQDGKALKTCDSFPCSLKVVSGENLSLYAVNSQGYFFKEWKGCGGLSSDAQCRIKMASNKSVSVTYSRGERPWKTLMFTKIGSGEAYVSVSQKDCSAAGSNGCFNDYCDLSKTKQCVLSVADGVSLSLKASYGKYVSFLGWGGACSGSYGDTCSLSVDNDKAVDVQFDQGDKRRVTISREGKGSGIVVDRSNGIECSSGTRCDYYFPIGATLNIEAQPDSRSSFFSWSGGCSTARPCAITLKDNMDVVAIFNRRDNIGSQTALVRVATAGNGTGRITSNKTEINCGKSCTSVFSHDTLLLLTAVPDKGSVFERWSDESGRCGDKDTCSLSLEPDSVSVTALFKKEGEIATQINANPPVAAGETRPVESIGFLNSDQKGSIAAQGNGETLPPGVLAQVKRQNVFNPKANAKIVKKYAAKFIYVKEPGNGDWYVDPVSGKRYLVDKSRSLEIAEKVATSISLKDISSIPSKAISYAEKSEFDTDGDGLADVSEAYFGTKANETDTDGDGYSDFEELKNGYNPLGPGKVKASAGVYKKYENKFVRLPDGKIWFVTKSARYPIFNNDSAYMAFIFVGGTYVPLAEANQIPIGDESLLK